MLWALIPILKHELAFLVMDKMTAIPVIPESGLVQEGVLMTPTLVETRPTIAQIMVIRTSRPWATFLFSDSFS